MNQEIKHPILKIPIQSLDVSDEFKEMASANEFECLEEILRDPLHTLPLKMNSGYRVLKELLQFLRDNGLFERYVD